ncbi:MAG: hypothetical protein WCS70_02425 [Verrucomicrobiota bacterium]
MEQYARISTAASREIIPIARPYSLFDFLRKKFGPLEPLLEPLHRILSQVRAGNGQTMVVEELAAAEDLRQENEDIAKCFPGFTTSRAYRLSFFCKPVFTLRGLRGVAADQFIGYAIVKQDDVPSRGPVVRVYESVLRGSRHRHNYVRGQQQWACAVAGRLFKVAGYMYAQQNGVTNVCAHVALRTAAARFHKDGDMLYREMNQLVGIDHVARTVADGLDTKQMVQILEASGARCFAGDYSKPTAGTRPPFQKFLYGSIESGYPAIIVFATTDASGSYHAVPVYGHTFSEDTWVPDADFSYFKIGTGTQYIPSESWLSMFIAHDDNWGSNFCIPRHYLSPQSALVGTSTSVPPTAAVAYVIGTFPRQVKVNSIVAEAVGADYLFTIHPQLPTDGNPWSQRLREYANTNRLILRPLLVEAGDYQKHLTRVRDWDGSAIRTDLLAALRTSLPSEKVWMIELSVPNLFSANKRKVGEVLLRAEVSASPKRDFSNFLLARLPGYFALYDGGGAVNPKYQFIPSGAPSHVELYGCEEHP